MAQGILIIGACSAIAKQVARIYAQQGEKLCLLARNEEKLKSLSDDLLTRGAAGVDYIVADMNTTQQHQQHLDQAHQLLGQIDVVLVAHGTLSKQDLCENSQQDLLNEILTNGLSAISFMTLVAQYFEKNQAGSLAVISSVAGDRGRKSNYVYGSAKALLSTFSEGMIARFADSDVHVLLIKPGFVDTPMTAEFNKGLLWAQPNDVAKSIVRAIENKKDILYTPFFWYPIMQIIKLIPNFIFKRLPL